MAKKIMILVFLLAASARAEIHLRAIRLPPGFKIEIFADHVKNAREMTLGPNGIVFVGTRKSGRLYALVPRWIGSKRKVIQLVKGLESPNGVAFRDGSLYVAERSRILRYDDIEHHLNHLPDPVVLRSDYPTEENHGWKFIAFGPDGMLYVPVGAPCNNCKSQDPMFASITRLSPDGKTREIYAAGIRNTVGFDWDPQTHDLWFTDNGRDNLGDDSPPDELNTASRLGMDFGYPYCHGGDISDPEFGKEKPCSDFVPPAQRLGPHVAALGMRFYTGTMFPDSYRHSIFIAEHGSWNRTTPLGYRVTEVRLDKGRPVSYTVFAEGWLPSEAHEEDPHRPTTLRADESAEVPKIAGDPKKTQAWGRPVDVLVMPDGSLLVSDDSVDAVYRIIYKK